MDTSTTKGDNTSSQATTLPPSPRRGTSWPQPPAGDFNPSVLTSEPPHTLAATTTQEPRPHSPFPPAYAALTTPHSALRTPHPALDRAEKYERLAFTFCKMGTTGLLAWLLTPPIFVLLVAVAAVVLYGRALTLGLTRSRCFLRKPTLIIAFWGLVAVADVAWLVLSRRA